MLDADEELGEADAAAISQLPEQPEVYGYYVQMISFVGASPGEDYVTDAVCRLFRNDARIAYTGQIHEDIVPSIVAIPDARIMYAPVTVRHYGYLDDVLKRKKKNERNLAILQKAVEQSPDDQRMQYALGTEYFQTGDFERALLIFQPLISQIPVFTGFMSDLVLKTVFCLRETGRREDALSLSDEALLFYPDYTDLWELKATIHLDDGRRTEALEAVLQSLQAAPSPMQYTTSSGSGTYRSHYLAATLYEQLFRLPEAATHYRRALDYHPGYIPAWHRWAWHSILLGKEEELLARLSEGGDRLPASVSNVVLEAAVDSRATDVSGSLLKHSTGRPINPLLYVSVLIQVDEDEQAKKLLQGLIGQPDYRNEAALAMWALALKHDDWAEAMKWMEQLSIADPSFSAAEALLKGDPVNAFPIAALRRCQQALLRSGAWEALLHLLRLLRPGPGPAAEWLPARAMYPFLSAPPACRHALLALCAERREGMSFAELIVSGVAAHSIDDVAQAVAWFQAAREADPSRLEPLVGLADSYAAAAGRTDSRGVLSLQMHPKLCLLGL